MIVIGILFGIVGIGFLCWLLFSLAVYALPFFAAVSAGLWAYHGDVGPVGAIFVQAGVPPIPLAKLRIHVSVNVTVL